MTWQEAVTKAATVEGFRTWLASKSPLEEVGKLRDSDNCPVARYFQETTGFSPLGVTCIRVVGPPGEPGERSVRCLEDTILGTLVFQIDLDRRTFVNAQDVTELLDEIIRMRKERGLD